MILWKKSNHIWWKKPCLNQQSNFHYQWEKEKNWEKKDIALQFSVALLCLSQFCALKVALKVNLAI